MPSLWNLLPSIVVIGGQSSGKSSVLEAVVGTDFLPRGTGIVTKRPLVLQLVHVEDPDAVPYGEFLHAGPRKFVEFAAIRKEIEEETIRHLSKVRKPVSPDPIQLAIYSPKVPNLTMVDMPGLTKVPIDGQPKSIVQDLENMARTYIKGDNAIILAVTPANADLATSDALHLAREVDPAGERTIGVLTKLDIMDKGTDARAVLDGQSVRLKHGWIAVVNRGQKDINDNLSMEAARSNEMQFFQSNPAYAGCRNIGTDFLSNKLSTQLVRAIQQQLPVITSSIDNGIISVRKEVDAMGGQVIATRGGMIHLILQLCRQFEDAFTKAIDGGKGGGERILQVFETRLTQSIKALSFAQLLESSNVDRVISEADGYQPHLVAPEMGYRRLLQECLILFKGPGDQAVEEVHAILRQIVGMVLNGQECSQLQRYIVLKREIATVAAASLEKMKEEARDMVGQMVEMERSYLTAEVFREILASTHAVDEMSAEVHTGLALTLDGRSMADMINDGPEEDRHLRTIAAHTSAYITHVRRQLKHTLPKAIVHCLVMQSKKKLLDKLHEEVAAKEDGGLKRMLGEDESVAKKREELFARLQMLEKAKAELSEANY
jgi:dynamin 1-like protein